MGILVNLEGNDAAGKSTQVQLIREYYESEGKSVSHIHFPMYGHNEFSEMISKFLRGEYGSNDDVDPIFIANIYSMDRYMFLPELNKLLNDFDVVIVDRYVFSNVAYQVSKLEEDDINLKGNILNHEFNYLGLPYPDLILFFDVPINEIEKRLNKDRHGEDREYLKGKQDVHEKSIYYQEKVRNVYLSLNHMINYHVIKTNLNGNILTPEEIFNEYKILL